MLGDSESTSLETSDADGVNDDELTLEETNDKLANEAESAETPGLPVAVPVPAAVEVSVSAAAKSDKEKNKTDQKKADQDKGGPIEPPPKPQKAENKKDPGFRCFCDPCMGTSLDQLAKEWINKNGEAVKEDGSIDWDVVGKGIKDDFMQKTLLGNFLRASDWLTGGVVSKAFDNFFKEKAKDETKTPSFETGKHECKKDPTAAAASSDKAATADTSAAPADAQDAAATANNPPSGDGDSSQMKREGAAATGARASDVEQSVRTDSDVSPVPPSPGVSGVRV